MDKKKRTRFIIIMSCVLAAILVGIFANAGTATVPDDGRTVAALVVTNCARLAEISAENNGVERFFDVSASLIEPLDRKIRNVI